MTSKRILITQSNYIPWKGYFDAIAAADELVLLDTVQFTRRDWRNRNRIKTPHGTTWLTVPVQVAGNRSQSINETLVADPAWAQRHWKTLSFAYARSPHFAAWKGPFEAYYLGCAEASLSRINEDLIRIVCGMLGVTTPIRRAEEFEASAGRSERLLDICRQAGATDYFSGPSAAAYLDTALFSRHGIAVHFLDFSGYPEYPQLHPPFDHHVSVLDLIFNTGEAARALFRSPRLLASHSHG